jgi:hypothetical protein
MDGGRGDAGLLAALGALGAHAGGAPKGRAALRVVFWGVMAMAATGAIGGAGGDGALARQHVPGGAVEPLDPVALDRRSRAGAPSVRRLGCR